jgi:hypothetical protein
MPARASGQLHRKRHCEISQSKLKRPPEKHEALDWDVGALYLRYLRSAFIRSWAARLGAITIIHRIFWYLILRQNNYMNPYKSLGKNHFDRLAFSFAPHIPGPAPKFGFHTNGS